MKKLYLFAPYLQPDELWLWNCAQGPGLGRCGKGVFVEPDADRAGWLR